MTVDYGGKGCRCWRGDDYNPWDDRTHSEWIPNALCVHHGLLAEYVERKDTGVYAVVSPPPEPDDRQPAQLSEGSVTCGRCGWTYVVLAGHPPVEIVARRHEAEQHATTEEESRGVAVRAAAAVRRTWRRIADRAWRIIYGDVDYRV